MKVKDFTYTTFVYHIDGKWATLLMDIDIYVYTDKGTYHYAVKRGFKWNGNSGAFPCRFSKDNERYNIAIMVHDLNYHGIGLSKYESDEMLCFMLKKSGYCSFMCELIHKAVELFGRKAFASNDAQTMANIPLIKLWLDGETLWDSDTMLRENI